MSTKTKIKTSRKTADLDPNGEVMKFINSADPEVLKNLLKDIQHKAKNHDKSKCLAGKRISTHENIKSTILSGKIVYYEKTSKGFYHFYTQCSKNRHGNEDFCVKHHESKKKESASFFVFQNKIDEKGVMKATEKDIEKLEQKEAETTSNPNPVLRIIVTKGIQKKIRIHLGTDTDQDQDTDTNQEKNDTTGSAAQSEEEAEEAEEEGAEEEDGEAEEEDAEAEAEEEAVQSEEEAVQSEAEASAAQSEEEAEEEAAQSEEEEAEEEAEESEAEECKEVTTRDGRTLYLDENKDRVYELDSDGEGTLLGTMMEVTSPTAPFIFKANDKLEKYPKGGMFICGVDMEHKKLAYIRCVLSSKLYQKNDSDGKIVQVGHVDFAENGTCIPVFHKTKSRKR